MCRLVDRHKGRAGTKKAPRCVSGGRRGSGEGDAVLKFAGPAIGGDEPFEVTLEDALVAVAEELKQGIEAALGGGGLPATIEQSDEVFADFGDLVAVEADHADALMAVHRGVAGLPIAGGVGGGVHLSFDLAHLDLGLVWCGGWFPSPR